MADVQAAAKKPLAAFGLKLKEGRVAPAALAGEVAPPKADDVKPVKAPDAAKPAAVRGMFAGIVKAKPAAAVNKPKKVNAAAAAAPKKPAAVAVAPAVDADAAEPVAPELADMLVAREAPAPPVARAATFEGELKEMADLILDEEGRDLYNTAVPEAYVPETRRGFSDFIKTTYSTFRLPEGPITVGKGEKYYPYQKFVRDYMRKDSPYRGVLVYHGLGSGKTCTSIATAEALYANDHRRIIVMTPASLRKNFQSEVSFCGFRHFQYTNYWVELDPADPTTTLFASQVLSMSAADIKASRSIWVPDFRRPPEESNFENLAPEQRDEIRKQIQRRLEYYKTTNPKGRMQFINYNGITNDKLLEMSCLRNEDGSGPFDNAVIIIDEVHNLVRMMQASIEPYLRASLEAQGIAKEKVDEKKARHKGRKRVVPVEPITHESWTPSLCPAADDFKRKPVVGADGKVKMVRPALPKLYTRAYMLFRMLTSAKNVKIVALSGTPIINFPEEIGILANILHGFTTVVTGKVLQTGEAAKRLMEATGKAHPFVDFVEARKEEGAVGAGSYTVTMSLLPEGIRKISNDEGVERIPPEEGVPGVPEIVDSIKAAFAAAGVSFEGGKVAVTSEELMPMFHDEFKDAFLEGDFGEKLRKDRVSVLITRLTGLISFYKGSNQEMMPRVKVDEIVRVPFSLYAQRAYSARRGDEIEKDKSKKTEKDISDVWKKIYGMSDSKSSNNYKTASRQACNFAFPPVVARPIPSSKQEEAAEAEEGYVADEDNLFFEQGTQEEAEAALNAEVVEGPPALSPEEDLDGDEEAAEAAAEDAEILNAIEGGEEGATQGGGGEDEENEEGEEGEEESEYIEEDVEENEAGAAAQEGGEGEENSGPVIAAAPAAAVAAPPAAPKKTIALLREEKRLKDAMEQRAQRQGPPETECVNGKSRPGEDYIKGTCERAKECLRTTAKKYMLLSNEEDGLAIQSPKMAAMLQRVLDTPGSSLVYSSFLALEGIGIFTVAMDVNGFAPIRIVERPLPGGGHGIDFDDESKASIMKGPGQNRYMLFTGGEKPEVRRMYLNIFNAKFGQLPANIANLLQTYGFKDNKVGQLCRVFCITSAGAEGLSLRNVRAVHIMEPYWNFVRMRQVKGRAVRIGSHLDLPEADRDVSIYTYVSVFPQQAQGRNPGDYRIEVDIAQSDSIEDQAIIKDLGFPLLPGQKSYVMTTDEVIYAIMERKRKIFDTMETLLRASAVDCELNYKQNKDGSFVCLPLKGKVGDFLYHPVLQRDLAEGARFKVPDFMTAAPGVPVAAAPVAAAPAPVPAAAAAPAPVAAAAPALAPAPAPTAVKKKFGKRGIIYRMEIVRDEAGTPIGFDMYEDATNKLAGRAGYKDGAPAAPVKPVPGWVF